MDKGKSSMRADVNNVLTWDKPKQVMSKEEWKDITADSAPAGVYTPNMSTEDKLRWKAKLIGGNDPRVEIRKSFHFTNGEKYPHHSNYGCQMLIVVRRGANKNEPQVLISMNGKAGMSMSDALDMSLAIQEAFQKLL